MASRVTGDQGSDHGQEQVNHDGVHPARACAADTAGSVRARKRGDFLLFPEERLPLGAEEGVWIFSVTIP